MKLLVNLIMITICIKFFRNNIIIKLPFVSKNRNCVTILFPNNILSDFKNNLA